jgi:hypothetical protein
MLTLLKGLLMKVKEYYSHFSEQLMFEWTHLTPTAWNSGKRYAYAFWQAVKNLEAEELNYAELIRISKIQDNHTKEFGTRKHRK